MPLPSYGFVDMLAGGGGGGRRGGVSFFFRRSYEKRMKTNEMKRNGLEADLFFGCTSTLCL